MFHFLSGVGVRVSVAGRGVSVGGDVGEKAAAVPVIMTEAIWTAMVPARFTGGGVGCGAQAAAIRIAMMMIG